jgi:hypothetical protein
MVRTVGKSLSKGNRLELAIGNITRRVLYIIRQECAHALRMEETGISDATVNVSFTVSSTFVCFVCMYGCVLFFFLVTVCTDSVVFFLPLSYCYIQTGRLDCCTTQII